jgi:cytochrome c-type biogenesis protein CcmE
MDPHRKRTIRFVVALTCALLLAGALAYTSFSSASEASTPSQLASGARVDKTYQLTGKVAEGSWTRRGAVNEFRVRDRTGRTSVPVRYEGSVPDPFKEGREIVIDVRKQGTTFVGQRDTLVTKCPSKFTTDKQSSSQ